MLAVFWTKMVLASCLAVLFFLGVPIRADEIGDLRAEVKKLKEIEAALREELAKIKTADKAAKAEEAFAKGVAEDFFRAVKGKDFGAAAALMSSELKRGMAPAKDVVDDKDLSYSKTKLDDQLAGYQYPWRLRELGSSPQSTPDMTAVVCSIDHKDGTFGKIRVEKEKGKWRVAFFSK